MEQELRGGLFVRQKQMFAWQKMIRLRGRTTWEQEAIQVPFQGQWQNKQEIWGNQRALHCLLSQSALHIYFDIHIHTGKPSTEKNEAERHGVSCS